ncbi:MAG: hypothetical protein ACI9HU_001932, partial [Colwellia sp.]
SVVNSHYFMVNIFLKKVAFAAFFVFNYMGL